MHARARTHARTHMLRACAGTRTGATRYYSGAEDYFTHVSAGANDMHDDAGGELRAVNNSGQYSTFLYAQVTAGKGSDHRVKGTGYSGKGTDYRVQGTGYRVKGTDHCVMGTGNRVKGTIIPPARLSLDASLRCRSARSRSSATSA